MIFPQTNKKLSYFAGFFFFTFKNVLQIQLPLDKTACGTLPQQDSVPLFFITPSKISDLSQYI